MFFHEVALGPELEEFLYTFGFVPARYSYLTAVAPSAGSVRSTCPDASPVTSPGPSSGRETLAGCWRVEPAVASAVTDRVTLAGPVAGVVRGSKALAGNFMIRP